MSATTPWPPQDTESLKLWLLDELPILRERLEVLQGRIEQGQAVLHQPVTARLSQINVARTTTSDPTFQVVALWVDQLPALILEARTIEGMMDEYRRAKAALTDRQRKIVEGRYEYYLARTEICVSLSISPRTYDTDHTAAIVRMFSVVEWLHQEGESGHIAQS